MGTDEKEDSKGTLYLAITFLLFIPIIAVNGLRVAGIIGLAVFCSIMYINWLMIPVEDKEEGVKAESLCGCRLRQ